MSLIDICDVSYIYPRSEKYALENINVSIEEGEFFAVMGENGAGKTTFCKLINGIIPHLSGGCLTGNVIVGGINTINTTVPQMAEKTGMVFDDPDAQLFTSSVRHEAAFGPENLLLPPGEIIERVNFALCAAGLSGFEERIPSTLSGGEKQRLSIAAALAMKSRILVLDEPLCRLDPDGVRETLAVLDDIKKKFQVTIIMAAHNSREILEYADRVCVLNNGKIAAIDTAENIFADNELLEQNGIQPVSKTAKDMNNKKNFEIKANAMRSSAVNIENFCFNYKNGVSIKNVNLSIKENDFIALTGRNGCGKTTLLKNITGLLRPSSGEIYIRGKNAKDLKVCDISKEIGFVMQNPDTQLFTDSVYKEVSFALKNLKLPKAQIRSRAGEALKTAELNDYNAFPQALSRADRTKLAIACVLAMGCKIIILDEIDAGLDYKDCMRIMNILTGLHSRGFTIIFVTHNIFLAREYAEKIINMSGGDKGYL